MRPIKFRGYTKGEEPHWIYGFLDFLQYFQGEYEIPAINYYDDEIGFDQRIVDEKSVGQFTGAYDNEGNEIYEGDIVLVKDGLYEGKKAVVRWDTSGLNWVIRCNDGNGEWLSEICGTIGIPQSEDFANVAHIFSDVTIIGNEFEDGWEDKS